MVEQSVEFIDIGVNLSNSSLIKQVDAVIERAKAASVNKMIVTGTSLVDSEIAIALCEQFPDQLHCTVGIHPHDAKQWDDQSLLQLQALSEKQPVCAIGETGLDFNRNYSPQEQQLEVFAEQLQLAQQNRKPLFCHQRDAHSAFISLLKEYRNELKDIVVHCFTDNKKALYDYLDLDCHIGITGWICDERRGIELQQLVPIIPADKLMLETDAPYLLPRDLDPKPKSRINEPMHLPHIAATVARLQKKELEQLASECLRTTLKFFSI